MIKNNEPISLAEIKKYAKDNKEIVGFLKGFTKITSKDAEELKKKLGGLDLMKLDKKTIVKLVDLLPEDNGDLNKILKDVELNEDETKKILETIKEYK